MYFCGANRFDIRFAISPEFNEERAQSACGRLVYSRVQTNSPQQRACSSFSVVTLSGF
jgi:hypothetical protein